MALNGVGFRFAADVLAEVSLHLFENIVYTTAISIVGPGGYGTGGYGQFGYGSGPPEVIKVASTANMYLGAMIIVGWGLSTAEVVTIMGVTSTGYIYTTALVNPHNPGEIVFAPTFPTQQTTDPHFLQSEMLGYLSRAQNELLADVPVNYALSQQTLQYGSVFQNTPANCIEINRIAASQIYIAIATLTRTGNVVTAVTTNKHGLQKGSTLYIQNPTTGFGGVFQVATVPSPTSFTYPQIGTNGSATGGAVLYFNRMYETTMTEITMTDRTWRNDYIPTPTAWGEDRSGLYRWFVNGKPSSNFPVELLCSIRDTDTLGLLDGFLIPDLLVPTLKYKVLSFAWSKDGVCQDPQRAAWCEERYKRGVLAIQRYLLGMNLGLKAAV